MDNQYIFDISAAFKIGQNSRLRIVTTKLHVVMCKCLDS